MLLRSGYEYYDLGLDDSFVHNSSSESTSYSMSYVIYIFIYIYTYMVLLYIYIYIYIYNRTRVIPLLTMLPGKRQVTSFSAQH